MGFGRLAILSVMAGAFIALGGILSVTAGYGFPAISACNPAIQKLFSALAFPVGLFLIVLLGAELFTGNNAVLIPGCASRRFGFGAVVRNWTLVWIFTGGVGGGEHQLGPARLAGVLRRGFAYR